MAVRSQCATGACDRLVRSALPIGDNHDKAIF